MKFDIITTFETIKIYKLHCFEMGFFLVNRITIN